MSLGVTKTSRSAKHSPPLGDALPPPPGRPCQSCFLLHCLVLWAARASPFEKLLQQSRLLLFLSTTPTPEPKSALLTGYHGALERFGCFGSCTFGLSKVVDRGHVFLLQWRYFSITLDNVRTIMACTYNIMKSFLGNFITIHLHTEHSYVLL